MKTVKIEICCGSADDVIEAYKAGADRAELNSNLFIGGLTPSVGALRDNAQPHSSAPGRWPRWSVTPPEESRYFRELESRLRTRGR
jgi:hypothetical protein